MSKGTVKKIVSDKGFGFITPDDGDKDVFFHCSAAPEGLFETLKEGDPVEYGVESGAKGPRAVGLQPA